MQLLEQNVCHLCVLALTKTKSNFQLDYKTFACEHTHQWCGLSVINTWLFFLVYRQYTRAKYTPEVFHMIL